MTTGKDIPREIALKLCAEIRAENRQKRFSPGGFNASSAISLPKEMWTSRVYPATEAATR